MDFRAIGMGLLFAFIWSSAFTSARIIVVDASPVASLAFRFLISGLIGIAIARRLGQTWHLTRAQWKATFVFGERQSDVDKRRLTQPLPCGCFLNTCSKQSVTCEN